MRTVVFGGQGDPGFDPEPPSAYPVEGRVGLLGEVPVRLRAEGLLLPASAGDARILAAVGLGVAGALAGAWLGTFGSRFAVGVIGLGGGVPPGRGARPGRAVPPGQRY
jgi:hypothetical protein